MKFELKKELPIIAIALLPFVYLLMIYVNLPQQVPTHWNSDLKIDAWGNKSSLWFMIGMLMILSYGLFTVIPSLDPKKKIELMGGKFHQFKFGFVLSISILAITILYTIKNQSISNISMIFVPIGLLFMFLGNYFKTIQPNYFVGIKTPWTLNNEEIWKATHLMAGKYWLAGGLLIIISSFILNNDLATYLFLIISAIIVLIPVIYSYKKSKELNKS